MKKIALTVMMALFVTMFAGCQNNEQKDNPPATVTEAPTEGVKPTEEPAKEEVTVTPEPTGVPAEPTMEPTPEPTTVPDAEVTDTPEQPANPEPDTEILELGTATIGSEIVLGRFEQDSNLENGAEPIEWQVVTVEDGRVLLLSKYCLEYMPFNESNNSRVYWWSKSTIRAWLSDEFYHGAFDLEEKAVIAYGEIKNSVAEENLDSASGCGGTFDRVFLLSDEEVKTYLSGENEYMRFATATPYVEGKELRVKSDASKWLTRTGFSSTNIVTYVPYEDGGYWSQDNATRAFGVRPAMWVWVDSEAKANSAKLQETVLDFSNVKVNDIVTLGEYEQDNSSENGTDPIEWKVLAVEDGKALLVSRYCLEYLMYQETWPEDNEIYWEMSSIRTWLNTYFMEEAFSDRERSFILLSQLENPADERYADLTYGGPNTADYVFLLSKAEAEQYMPTDADRIARATDYANNNGLDVEVYDGVAGSDWFIRTPGSSQYISGAYTSRGYWTWYQAPTVHGIRPAMWIKID